MEINHELLNKIIKVKNEHRIESVNLLLEAGWILLNVHTEDHGHPKERHQTTIYSLGWSSSKGHVLDPIQEREEKEIEEAKKLNSRWD